VVTNDGTNYKGTLLNEDSFTIQFVDMRERVHSLDKSSLKSWKKSRQSLMPVYDEKALPEKDLQDLLHFWCVALREVQSERQTDFRLGFAHCHCNRSCCAGHAAKTAECRQEPQNWADVFGDYAGRRFSSLRTIKLENAEKLGGVRSGLIKRWLAENLKRRRWWWTELCMGPDRMIAPFAAGRADGPADLAIPTSATSGYSSMLRPRESWSGDSWVTKSLGNARFARDGARYENGNIIWEV